MSYEVSDVVSELIDRLVAAEGKLGAANQRADEARAQAQRSDQNQISAAARAAHIERKQKDALPLLLELHQSAAAVLAYLQTISPSDNGAFNTLRERLKKALADVGQYCDEIPF